MKKLEKGKTMIKKAKEKDNNTSIRNTAEPKNNLEPIKELDEISELHDDSDQNDKRFFNNTPSTEYEKKVPPKKSTRRKV